MNYGNSDDFIPQNYPQNFKSNLQPGSNPEIQEFQSGFDYSAMYPTYQGHPDDTREYPTWSGPPSNEDFGIPMRRDEYSQQYSPINENTNEPKVQVTSLPTFPLMPDLAMMYGDRFVNSGKEMVDKEINKFISLSRLKFYFDVDTTYVFKKFAVLLYPYRTSWIPQVRKGRLATPRQDVNAPDLYIPLMTYLTYTLLAGIDMGMKHKFSPEVLGLLAGQALACVLIEIVVQLITIFILDIHTRFSNWDLLAFTGYKFFGVIVALFFKFAIGNLAYYLAIIYCGFSLAFFLLRVLKWRIISETLIYNPNFGGEIAIANMYQGKRRLYLLLFIAFSQPILMWALSYNFDFKQNEQMPS